MRASEPDQCVLRSFSLFLHKKGLFGDCVKRWQAVKGNRDWVSILEEIYGASLGDIEADWKEWIKNQPIDDEVNLVPRAFVLENQQWQYWWNINKSRLYWSEEDKVYRVRDGTK